MTTNNKSAGRAPFSLRLSMSKPPTIWFMVASILSKAVAGETLGQPEYDTIDGNIDPVLAEIEGIVLCR